MAAHFVNYPVRESLYQVAANFDAPKLDPECRISCDAG